MDEKSNLDLLTELGVDTKSTPKATYTAREERIIAGFEEIQGFVDEHDRMPEHGENNDIFEKLYATRLEQIRKQPDCVELLADIDHQGLLGNSGCIVAETPGEYESDSELLAELGLSSPSESDITNLQHVKPRVEIRAAEEIAQRIPCPDFDKFRPVFESVQNELSSGLREAKLLLRSPKVGEGDLFILHGQKVYVAKVGEKFKTEYDRIDRRLRVIYDNGTESALLFRSLQRALEKDEAGRRIVDSSAGPLFDAPQFAGTNDEGDLASGTIYVLRSKSDHPLISEHRNIIHKIGVTGGNIKNRISNTKLDPTFLMADVEIVASYELFNINRSKLEGLIHKFFEAAKLDIEIPDRFGKPVVPKEWFLVPLNAIDDAVTKIKNGTIVNYIYDTKKACLNNKQIKKT